MNPTSRAETLEQIIELSSILNRLNDFGEIVRIVAEKMQAFFGADAALVFILNPDTQNMMKTVIDRGTPAENKDISLVKTKLTGWNQHRLRTIWAFPSTRCATK